MSETQTEPRSRKGPVIAVALLVVAAVAGAGWYFLIRDDSPPAFDIDTAAGGAEDPQDSTDETTDDSDDEIEGSWTVDPDAGGDAGGSSAGFRVQEELASVGASTAVGRTPAVDGDLTIEGTTVTAVDVTVDMTQLESNDQRRDDRMLDALVVDEFPTSTFTLTQPIELGELPTEGETISATATGDLTIKGVTKTVDVTLDAQLVEGVLVVVGSTPVVFDDYGIEKPTAPIVVSIEDEGTIEFQLFFSRA